MRISVDVGGTFTDVVTLDPDSGNLRLEKVETVPKIQQVVYLKGFERLKLVSVISITLSMEQPWD